MNMPQKNEIIDLKITGITNEGNGVGRYNNIAVFVPFTAVGDVIKCRIVKVRKSFCYGIVSEIVSCSPARQEPDCSVYGKCGGCVFRHFTYEEELRVKEQSVKDSFLRIGGLDIDTEPMLGSEDTERYRNKAQFPVSEIDGRAVCGFYSRRSHRIVECGDCKLQPEIFHKITSFIMEYVRKNNISAYDENSGRGLLRHICLRRAEHTHEISVCLVVTAFDKCDVFMPLAKLLPKSFSDIKA